MFEVTGELEKLELNEDQNFAVDEVVDSGDRVRVEGTIGYGDDRFAFSGELVEVDVPSEVVIEVRNRSGERDESRVTVLDDFEDGRWPDDWEGETRGYAITERALDENFAIEATGSVGYPDVRKPTAETPRGYTYTVRTVPGSGDAKPTLLTNCQRSDAMADAYAARLLTDSDELLLEVRRDGNGTELERVAVDRPLSAGTEYTVALDVGPDWVRARALASDGSELAATDGHPDTTYDGGTPGLYTGGATVAGTRYDQYTRWPVGER